MPTTNTKVRFLRALYYWYFLDLWHKAPFKDENNSMNDLPVEKVGKDLYDWLDAELTAIESEMAPMGQFNTASDFGRADAGAAYMLHARLALNAHVYTDGATTAYDKAISYCDKLIAGPYALSSTAKTNPTNGLTYSGYAQLFMADNDQNNPSGRCEDPELLYGQLSGQLDPYRRHAIRWHDQLLEL